MTAATEEVHTNPFQAGAAERVAESRRRSGVPPTIEDAATLARLATIFRRVSP